MFFMPHNLELVLELIKAGLAYKIHHTSSRCIPLAAQINHNKFKAIIKERNLKKGLRISHENFTKYGKIQTVPMYAVRNIIAP